MIAELLGVAEFVVQDKELEQVSSKLELLRPKTISKTFMLWVKCVVLLCAVVVNKSVIWMQYLSLVMKELSMIVFSSMSRSLCL